ncbi:MAG: hypothetical protein H6963_03490 [Chromatiaceae bacterium]|nr:hypothetical protein [Chromatiaceae bacterium]
MLRLEIDNRPLIPVRMIPFVTGWKFSPDVVASILANCNKIHRVYIPSFHFKPDGDHHPMLAKEWDAIIADLDVLDDTLSATETVDNENYPVWRKESIRILPAATFVWLDEMENAWRTAYSKDRMDLMDERPGDRELNLSPYIPPNVVEFIYEGFESLLIYPAPPGNESTSTNISLAKLNYYMMTDPFYGKESTAIESIIDNIYRNNAGTDLFQQFRRRFSRLPCKADNQRHLIYIWCGLLGLPAYRNDALLNWQREDFLDHWKEDFDLRLNEIKLFLRKHALPLPTRFFPYEVDNTERKLALSNVEFEKAFHDFTVLLPQLEKELAEIDTIQPESMKARQEKKAEKARIEQQIAVIKGHSPSPTNLSLVADAQYRFILTGDHWSITYEGQTSTFSNTKGLRYIAWLIQNQGKEIHVSHLYYAINPQDASITDADFSAMSIDQLEEQSLKVSDLGDAGDAMTPEGRNRIEAEVRRLQEKIDEAVEFGDAERRAELKSEQEKILRYLADETGLGGRSRKASSNVERIRKAVSNRINDAIQKIGKHHVSLSHHLSTKIQTGTQCRYAPEPPIEWIISTS